MRAYRRHLSDTKTRVLDRAGVSASKATDSGNTSAVTNILLLAAIAAVAGGVGFALARSRKLRPQS